MSSIFGIGTTHYTNNGKIKIIDYEKGTNLREIKFLDSGHIRKNISTGNILTGSISDVLQLMLCKGRIWKTKTLGLIIIRKQPTKGFLKISRPNEKKIYKIKVSEFVSNQLDSHSKKIINASTENVRSKVVSIKGMQYSANRVKCVVPRSAYYPGSMWLNQDGKIIKIIDKVDKSNFEITLDGERMVRCINSIKTRTVTKMDRAKAIEVGYRDENKYGRKYVITKIISYRLVEIQFLKTGNKKEVQRHLIKDGNFKDTIDFKYGIKTKHSTSDGIWFMITGVPENKKRKVIFKDGYEVVVSLDAIKCKSNGISRLWKYKVGSTRKTLQGEIFKIKEHLSNKTCLVKFNGSGEEKVMTFDSIDTLDVLSKALVI